MKYPIATSVVILGLLFATLTFFFLPSASFGLRYSSIPSLEETPKTAEVLFFREYLKELGLLPTEQKNIQMSPTQPTLGRKENEDRLLIETYRGSIASVLPVSACLYHSARQKRFILIVNATGRFSMWKARQLRPYWDRLGSPMARAFDDARHKI
jgi:hypothetical protein